MAILLPTSITIINTCTDVFFSIISLILAMLLPAIVRRCTLRDFKRNSAYIQVSYFTKPYNSAGAVWDLLRGSMLYTALGTAVVAPAFPMFQLVADSGLSSQLVKERSDIMRSKPTMVDHAPPIMMLADPVSAKTAPSELENSEQRSWMPAGKPILSTVLAHTSVTDGNVIQLTPPELSCTTLTVTETRDVKDYDGRFNLDQLRIRLERRDCAVSWPETSGSLTKSTIGKAYSLPKPSTDLVCSDTNDSVWFGSGALNGGYQRSWKGLFDSCPSLESEEYPDLFREYALIKTRSWFQIGSLYTDGPVVTYYLGGLGPCPETLDDSMALSDHQCISALSLSCSASAASSARATCVPGDIEVVAVDNWSLTQQHLAWLLVALETASTASLAPLTREAFLAVVSTLSIYQSDQALVTVTKDVFVTSLGPTYFMGVALAILLLVVASYLALRRKRTTKDDEMVLHVPTTIWEGMLIGRRDEDTVPAVSCNEHKPPPDDLRYGIIHYDNQPYDHLGLGTKTGHLRGKPLGAAPQQAGVVGGGAVGSP